MKITTLLAFLSLILLIFPPQTASALDLGKPKMENVYFGVAMFNPTYKTNTRDHRSTGLVGRLGYDLTQHFAIEAQAASSIGSEAAFTPEDGEMQMSNLYGVFLRANTQFSFSRVYAMAGYFHGTRVVKFPLASTSFEDEDSNKAFGFGAELSDDGKLGIALEWIRYFDNRYYTVEAWNLGIVSRF